MRGEESCAVYCGRKFQPHFRLYRQTAWHTATQELLCNFYTLRPPITAFSVCFFLYPPLPRSYLFTGVSRKLISWCHSSRPIPQATRHPTPSLNRLTPNDPYMCRTAPLTSKRCILYIYSTNIGTEYFKRALYSPFFSLRNAVCFIMLTCLVPVLFTFYIQDVLKLKK